MTQPALAPGSVEQLFEKCHACAVDEHDHCVKTFPSGVRCSCCGVRSVCVTDPGCNLCPLHTRATTVCVPGAGPFDTRIMLVGQNPGEQEDRAGEPFIGPAGGILDAALARAGLDRSRVYITDAAKCVTPSNRAPTAREVRACSVYLLAEIETIKPRVIVALGAEAFKILTGEATLTKRVGSELPLAAPFYERSPGSTVIVSYHPAAALAGRDPSKLEAIVAALTTARKIADDAFDAIPVAWRWIEGDEPVAKLREKIAGMREQTDLGAWNAKDQVVAFDLETNALPTWHPDFRIRMLSLDMGQEKVAVFRGAPILVGLDLLDALYDAGATLVGHNASMFDREGVLSRTNRNWKVEDTMLIAHALDPEYGKGLEDNCVRKLGVRPWKDEEIGFSWATGPQTSEEWEAAGLYNARDSRYDRALYVHDKKRLDADEALARRHREVILPASRALAKIGRAGVPLSHERVTAAMGAFKMQQTTALALARNYANNPKFNPGSAQQVKKVVFEQFGLPIVDWTDGGEPSTNEYALKMARLQTEADSVPRRLIDEVLRYREAVKMQGTYLDKYAKLLELARDGRAHPQYSLISSPSRTSTFESDRDEDLTLAIQTTPRDPRIRACFAAPPGYKLLDIDWSMLELRHIAWLAPEANMLSAFSANADIHRLMAATITGKAPEAVLKSERSEAKPVNFGFAYGAKAYTFQRIALKDYDLAYTMDEAEALYGTYHFQWPSLSENYYPRIAHELFTATPGVIHSPSGAYRRLPNALSSDEHAREEALRIAINYPIQEISTVTALVGLVLLTGMGYEIVGFIHDGYLALVKEDEAEQRAAEAKAALEAQVPAFLASRLGVEVGVPLVVDAKVKETWGDAD